MTAQNSTRRILDSEIASCRSMMKGLNRFIVKPTLDLLLEASEVCKTDTDAQAYLNQRRSDSINPYLAAKELTAPSWNVAARLRNRRSLKRARNDMAVAAAIDSWFFAKAHQARQAERRLQRETS